MKTTIREYQPILDSGLTLKIGAEKFLMRLEGKRAYEFMLTKETTLRLLRELVNAYPSAVADL